MCAGQWKLGFMTATNSVQMLGERSDAVLERKVRPEGRGGSARGPAVKFWQGHASPRLAPGRHRQIRD